MRSTVESPRALPHRRVAERRRDHVRGRGGAAAAVPAGGATIDTLEGSPRVSLVAFEFRRTRVGGLAIPGHIHFPEINLRFYVRHGGERGVVFIRELVPRRAIATVARLLYNEPYQRVPMACGADPSATACASGTASRRGSSLVVEGDSNPVVPEDGQRRALAHRPLARRRAAARRPHRPLQRRASDLGAARGHPRRPRRRLREGLRTRVGVAARRRRRATCRWPSARRSRSLDPQADAFAAPLDGRVILRFR